MCSRDDESRVSIERSSRSQGDHSRIAHGRVRLVEEPIIVDHGARGSGSLTITPVFDGNVIQSLEIRCSCGQHLDLDCVYETGSDPQASAPSSDTSAPA